MPVIDLDSRSEVTPSRAPRWHRRWLVIMAAGGALLAVPGEPGAVERPFDAATVCSHPSAVGAVIVDVETGEVMQTLSCRS